MTQRQIPGRLGGRVSRPVSRTMSELGLCDTGGEVERTAVLFVQRQGRRGHLEAQVQGRQTKTQPACVSIRCRDRLRAQIYTIMH